MTSCQYDPLAQPCVANLTPFSVLLLLFCVQIYAGRRFVMHEKRSMGERNRGNVSTELPLLPINAVTNSPISVPRPQNEGEISPKRDIYWGFRVGISTSSLIFTGFLLEFLYFLSYKNHSDDNTSKGSISTFNMNDAGYILLSFLASLGIIFLLFRMYSSYHLNKTASKLRVVLSLGVGVSVGSLVGTGVIAGKVCGESGGLWIGGFYALLALEVTVMQLVVKGLWQSIAQ